MWLGLGMAGRDPIGHRKTQTNENYWKWMSSCSKSSAPHSAFASARLMALRRLVAGRALDFRNVSQGLPYQRHVLFVNHGHHIMKYVLLALPHQLQWYPPQLVSNTRVGGCWQGSLKCRGQSSASCQRTSSSCPNICRS